MEQFLRAPTSPNRLPDLVLSYCALHRHAATRHRIASAGSDLVRFSRETLPGLLRKLGNRRRHTVVQVADAIHDIESPLAGLTFLVERLEAEPAWYRRQGRDGWSQYGHWVARWRAEAKPPPGIQERVLAIVLVEIERDLTTMQPRQRGIYRRGHQWFWREKKNDFANVARRVIELHADSPAVVLYAADYLHHGLDLTAEAIDVLLAADARGKLREDGRHRLVLWLHEAGRFGDSLTHLEKLVALNPDQLKYRVLSVRALHRTGHDDEAKAFVDASAERWREQGRWAEHAIRDLGYICLESGFHTRSVTFFEEVIPLCQRTRGAGRSGQGDSALSGYYGAMAKSYVALGREAEAVEAAMAAVMSWGRRYDQRASALSDLRRVVEKLRDLDAFLSGWSEKAAETGRDVAVLRIAAARVYLDRKQPKRAIRELLVARRFEPDDREVHRLLVEAHDRAKDAEGACRALAEAARRFPREYGLFDDLGKRWLAIQREEEAERAFKSLVEAEPHEADGHRALAQVRERQKRHAEAITQWMQVTRIRSLEPDGWFRLAGAQIRAGRKDDAKRTLERVLATSWEPRFGDVHRKAARLLDRLGD
ncbi:MAG: tetratricopeptide repeat protein [Planctomycetota bacterium]|jgi:tetratricopeptide (TPR) repeat protein